MMILSSPLLRTMLVLMLFCFLLLFVPYLVPLPSGTNASRSVADLDSDDVIAAQSRSEFSKAFARPLFHINRQKEKPAPKSKETAPVTQVIKLPYLLIGVVGAGGSGAKAYIENETTHETMSVKEGQVLGDWKVEKIGQGLVTFVNGDVRKVVELSNGN